MNRFSTLLSTLRKEATLTNKQLASMAQVPDSLISGLQSGKRRVGERNARQIASALKLDGQALDEFVFAAINCCTEKLLEESKAYPAELINFVTRLLRKAGITASSIVGCAVTVDGNERSVTLLLENGTKATLRTRLQFE